MLTKITTKMLLPAGTALLMVACGALPPTANTNDAGNGSQSQGSSDPNTSPSTGDSNSTTGNPNAVGNPNAMGNPNATGNPNANCADAWGNYAQAFFKTNCVGCHSKFTDYSGVQADATIQSRINDGSMPPNATLPAADKTRILNWIGCKEPQ